MSYNSKPGYIDNLLILRGFCSIGVLLAHCLTLIPGFVLSNIISQNPIFASTMIGKMVIFFFPTTGANFVFTFFVHSGYLMGKIYWNNQYTLTRNSVTKFYINRLLRICPLLYFNLLICIFISGRFYRIFSRPIASLADFLFLNNFTNTAINDVAWSLSYEMQDYIICPLFFLFFAKKSIKNLFTIFGAIFILAVYSRYTQSHPEYTILRFLQFTWFFLGGYSINIIVRYLHENFHWRSNLLTKILAFLVFIISNLAFYPLIKGGYSFMAQVQLLLFAMVTLTILELPGNHALLKYNSISLGVFLQRGLTWLGLISYGVYLWHLPILTANISNIHFIEGVQILSGHIPFVPKSISINILFTSAILIQTVILSVVTFYLIELRFRPNLYNFKDSLILLPLKQKILKMLKHDCK